MTTTKNYAPATLEQAHNYQQIAESWLLDYEYLTTTSYTWMILAEFIANANGITLYKQVPSKLYPGVFLQELIHQPLERSQV